MIHHGDCIEVMAGMDPESVDAIVTDPPYGLEFMGKTWDGADGFRRSLNAADAGRDDVFGRTSRTSPEYRTSPMRRRPETDAVNAGMSRQGGRQWRGEDGQKRQARDMRTYQEWSQHWAQAAYRVAKPSSYLLAFGGTRTVHRMTCALEDAGWIIRDMLVWGYASGFPKSKASLKPAWEPIVMARKPGPLRMLAIDECRIGTEQTVTLSGPGKFTPNAYANGKGWDGADGTVEHDAPGRWPANIVLTDPIFDGGIEGVVGGGETGPSNVRIAEDHDEPGATWSLGRSGVTPRGVDDSGTYSRFFTIPQSGIMCEWCGVARSAETSSSRDGRVIGSAPSRAATAEYVASDTTTDSPTTSATEQTSWHDGSASTSRIGASPVSQLVVPSHLSRVRSAAPSRTSSDTTTTTPGPWMCGSCVADAMRSSMDEPGFVERNYPWAFLIPKAARSDREPVLGGLPERDSMKWAGGSEKMQGIAGAYPDGSPRPPQYRQNVHPTVKPVDLMRHLVRLVTPTGGTVLDPFLGSGTTALAAEMEGFEWIGIEREAEYVAIAEARLNGTQKGMAL